MYLFQSLLYESAVFSVEASVLWRVPAAATFPVDGAGGSDQSVHVVPGGLQTFLSQYYPSTQQSDHFR